MEWKMEQKIEKLYQTYINLMIFSSFPFDTLSLIFTFAGKVQQCLVTGSKWICYLLLILSWNQHAHTMIWFCVHCVSICNVELFEHYASIKKVLLKCEAYNFVTDRNMQFCYTLFTNLSGEHILFWKKYQSSLQAVHFLFCFPFRFPVQFTF